jgi:hypothetical protein
MFSLNKWVVKGKVMEVIHNQKGCWVFVRGFAKNPTLFDSDCFRIKCWISKRVLGDTKIKKEISLVGKFQFRNKDCYFVTDEIN